MVNAVRGYPENRPAFKRQHGAERQQIFHPLRRLKSAMREQAMVAHADARAARHPPQKDPDQQRLPREEKKRRHGAHVKHGHEKGRNPVHFVVLCRLPFQILQFHIDEGSPFPLTYWMNRLPLSYQAKRPLNCNTCVIGAFGAVTRVMTLLERPRAKSHLRRSYAAFPFTCTPAHFSNSV